MANLITAGRLVLLFVVVALAYQEPAAWRLAAAPLLILTFALDGVDGWVARRRGEVSLFGAAFDIAADRVVENVLWVALADLDLVPVWVAFVFLTRSFLVDSMRAHAAARGESAFGMMRTRLGRFLVAGRPMRAVYATTKAVVFCWILLLEPVSELAPVLWIRWGASLQSVTAALTGAALALCLARGLPVLAELAFDAEKEAQA